MKTMRFSIGIGILAGTINDVARVAARLGVLFSYAKEGGFLYRGYRCVAIGDEAALRRFRSYLFSIGGYIA